MGDNELDRLRAELAERDARIAALAARNAELEVQVAELRELVRVLTERLDQNSGNSNRPPSSDPPGVGIKKTKAKRKSKRRRGGQKGRRGSSRALLPADQVEVIEDLFPGECESCWTELPEVADANAKRYQQTELRPLVVHVTEWRRHAVVCLKCGHKTRARYDAEVIPRSAFGPRLCAVVAMLTGVYHLSRRQTVRLLDELLGVSMSLGTVSAIEKRISESIEPAAEEALERARAAPIKHADGTSWLRAGAMFSLWVIATAAVTVFKVLPNGKGKTLRKDLFGSPRGILVSDRATALKFWAMRMRQICWAHLVRKFVSFSERDGPAGRIGNELCDYTGVIFDYWSSYRDGRLDRATLIARMAAVRPRLEALLERAAAADIRGLSGSCADILEHREALWTFVDRDGVEPTNNHAERELRAIVMWRRRSFGSQSVRGDHFATRMMTVAHTARKQGRDLLAFLARAAAAFEDGDAPPSILAAA